MRYLTVRILLLVLLAGACDASVDDDKPGDGEAGATVEASTPEVDTAVDEPSETVIAAPADQDVGDLELIIDDIERFWTKKSRRLGFEYEPLRPERIVGVHSDDDELPVCDGEIPEHAEVEENAIAADCSEGNLVLYDVAGLFEPLADTFGPAGPAVTLAHEWGHIVEYQAGLALEGVMSEQFADCLAGAWVVNAFDRAIPPFDDEGASLDRAVGAMLDFRDEPGLSAEEQDAHGSGFDRVAAFQEGFESGVDMCATYVDEPPGLFQFPFGSDEEAATGGNLPLGELLEFVVPNLNAVFAAWYDGFPALTAEDVVDTEVLEIVHEELGDFASTTWLATQWAAVAQELTGAAETLEEGEAFIDQACLAGAWVDELLSSDSEFGLSPGDLDEGIMLLAEVVAAREDEASAGLLFAGVQALRSGFELGLDGCEE